MITALFFAHLADEAGGRARSFPRADTPQALRDGAPSLAFLHPGAVRVAVNGRWARWDTPLAEGDEVAFLPPWNAVL